MVWQSFRRSLRSLRGGLRGSCVGLRKSRGVTRRKIRQRRNARPFPTDEPRRQRIDSTENEKDYKGISGGVRGIEAKGACQSRCQCCCQKPTRRCQPLLASGSSQDPILVPRRHEKVAGRPPVALIPLGIGDHLGVVQIRRLNCARLLSKQPIFAAPCLLSSPRTSRRS